MHTLSTVLHFGLVILLTWTPVTVPVQAQEASPLPDEHALLQLLHRHDVPGVALATLTDCTVDEHVVVAGSARLMPEVAVTSRTAFEAASLSKPVFTYLVLMLADEGVIDLDRPLADTFTYARITDEAAYAQITPRMILTHRTGLPNWVDHDTDFFDRTTPVAFERPPGTVHSYSGEAFQLLQAYVEEVTGMTLQHLFGARLGDVMPHSTFIRPLPDGVRPSRAYRSAGDPSTGRGMVNLGDRAAAAYSLVTTAPDYARFLSHVCRGGGLHPETYADMLRPQSLVPEGEATLPTAYGLGWMIVDLGGQTFIGHGGDNGEYHALAGFIRETGDGLVILTNGARGRELIDAIVTPLSTRAGPGD